MFLATGSPAPWVTAASNSNPNFHFETVAGRYIVLSFFRSAADPLSQEVLEGVNRYRTVFDDEFCCFFGISIDPEDRQAQRLQNQLPGIRFLWDFEQQCSRQFNVVDQDGIFYPCTYLLDPRLRVVAVLPFDPSCFASAPTVPIQSHMTWIIEQLLAMPRFAPPAPADVQAPVLIVPRIFEPALCQALMDYYNEHGGKESGFMREKNGMTVPNYDNSFKRRRDQEIEDENLRNQAMYRIHDLLVPEIEKAFQFKANRMERHIVACYTSEQKGFFRAHRDNTSKGTAHRRFAVSVNLNTGEYEGGQLRFPEFGRHTYTSPAGGAVVFSCSLLHEATPVTSGSRYVYLPFLYDDSAAKLRQANRKFLAK